MYLYGSKINLIFLRNLHNQNTGAGFSLQKTKPNYEILKLIASICSTNNSKY